MRPAIFGIGGLLAVLLVVAAILVVAGTTDETIDDGVRIGSVDVGGMQRDEAGALLRRELGDSVAKRVRVTYGKASFVLRPEVAKARLDVDASIDAALDSDANARITPRVAFSRPAVSAFAARVAKRVNRDARDADIDWRDGKLDRTRARPGVEVQQPRLVASLAGAVSDASPKPAVRIPVVVTERPDRTFEDLAKRYPTVIAVDRDSKQLRLYKNLQLEHKYDIAVGKGGNETTAGRYKIQERKVDPEWNAPNSDWAGELAGQTIPAGDPRNPLEARWMGFNASQGIHGTADIQSLGDAASHGCIRMAVKDVKELYDEVELGTPVFVQ
ncbi:MAG TPA: L,D-transpeptidase family protein [Solirubrobacteraceae bacterium]|nr:L,D-transpeptidase family protein [Solirubrobacteraceae bacterium]